jgi:hypothetical protein
MRVALLIVALFGAGCSQLPMGQVADAKKVAANALRDPSSAQFRNVKAVTNDLGAAVCGEINGKNAFGGYAGFQDFVVVGQRAWVQTGADASSSVEDLEAETEALRRHTAHCY